MHLNIKMKDGAVMFVGGDPTKGQSPLVTTTLKQPQVLIDQENNTITVIEVK